MSKIAALAKARAVQKANKENDTQSTPTTSKSVSILDKLKSKKASQEAPFVTKPVSRLAALRNKKTLPQVTEKQKTSKTPIINPSKEPESGARTGAGTGTGTGTGVNAGAGARALTDQLNSNNAIILHSEIKFQNSSSFSKEASTTFSSIFIHPHQNQPTSYKRKLTENYLTALYCPFTNERLVKKIKENFSKPSPDEIVMSKHAQALQESRKAQEEEINQKVANLKISTPKKLTKPKVKIDLDAELDKRRTKPNTSFVVIGHVDAGKSTLTGRLLLDSNILDKNSYVKLKREAERAGKGSFSLAWIMDQTEEERLRGVTIDICVTQFETPNANFTIVDAPGHRDFVPNMITGVAQADIALLVIDSSTGEFEAGFNLDGQTKEHTLLARSLGIHKIVIAVNKMDNNDWNQDRFEEIQLQMTDFLKLTGYREDQIDFIPCSGLSGMNVSSRPTKPEDIRKLKWYNGASLLETLEKSDKFERDFNKPFVMTVSDINHSEFEFTGRIDTGMIQPGETVVFAPSGKAGVVHSLISNEKKSNISISGDNTTLKIKNIELDDIQVGDVISIVGTEIPSVSKFESKLLLFDMKRPLLLGTQFVLFRGNVQQPAKITKIISLFDKVTGKPLKKQPKHLSSHQSAIVEIELIDRPLPLQLFKDNKQLGRVILRKEGKTIGAGIVERY